ncbi:hypothetical protein DCAR_0831119 [Daucus carota subsp. sativus]|uniref:ApaG domain-containing protein n=1 Tax=Daucus carota subsp. sativus TaxID=79200 RepID=A0AAF1B9R5_DAUCS|nr:PREDICTED: F-box protein SKIP16 isoform X2 [Daucus carota subsp. sativus]WOH11629.1 hypothetical protein DCAR_0831119 [Daucus carota subsp. sativus]
MESVGGLAMHEILSKLGARETAIVSCVSRNFEEWASDDSLWAEFCARDLNLSSPLDPLGNLAPSFKTAYQAWRKSFLMYSWPLVVRVKTCWGRIITWLDANFPEVVPTLCKGATEDELDSLEKSLKLKLPLPTRLLYRFCNGQNLAQGEFAPSFPGSPLGLIGGYSFYGHLVNVCLLPLDLVISVTGDICDHLFPSAGPKYVVVAASTTESEKYFFLNCANGQLYVGTRNLFQDREMLPCVPPELIHSIHDAGDCQQQDAMLLWLEEHIRRLESGMIKVRVENNIRSINLFPEEPPLCSTAVTNGVQVRASALFVPEYSDLQLESDKYFFTYSIRMSLKPEGCIVDGMRFGSCQLYWRHWIIRENDEIVSDVNGEAVIGKHPLLHPGDKEFVYQSCSSQCLSQGSIEGSFTFVPGRLTDPKGAEFEVEVPRFFLQYPDYIF